MRAGGTLNPSVRHGARRAPAGPSVQERRVVLDRRALGRLGRLAGAAEIQHPDEPLVARQARPPRRRPRSAAPPGCASSPPARARGRRAARCRRRTRRRARPPRPGPGRPSASPSTTTSVGARSSFAAATRRELARGPRPSGAVAHAPARPPRAFSARERPRPDHAEAPRVREVVVRRPAGQLEQLLERLAVHRLGLEGLDRAPRADRLLDFHCRR